ncbi:MAG: hypothetical protein HOQ32_18775 [Lysobacter sp.]|nr:hypothetical protein [Lysobacter sp.]
MTATDQLKCARCDRFVRPKRALFGHTLCNACLTQTGTACPCTRCGRNTHVLPSAEVPLCFRCERTTWFDRQTCKRCGRSLADCARKRYPDGTASCSSCTTMLADPVACHYCGKWGLKRSRDYQRGFTELACHKCRTTDAAFQTCAGCRRYRLSAGERDGRPYCSHCLPTGAPPIITCVTCNAVKYRYNKDQCEDCAWEHSHRLLLARLAPQFKTAWARQLFERYHSEAKLKTLHGNWRKSLKRDIAFFQGLESAFDTPDQLNGVLIVRRLGSQFVKRYRRGMSFLAHIQLVVLDDDPDFEVERVLGNLKAIAINESDWIRLALERFLVHILNARARIVDRKRRGRIPVSPNSLDSAMRIARRLLIYARDEHGATSVREVSQEVLDQFIGQNKQARPGVSAYVRYLRRHEKTFHHLKLRKIPAPAVPAHLVLPEEERQHFIHLFSTVTEPKQVHWALVCLLNLLYAQLPIQLVRMERERVRHGSQGYEMRFAKVWLPLDPVVQPLMARWMNSRREFGAFDATNSSPYLFPGVRSGTHLRASASANFRRKFDYDARVGRVTALAAMIRGGLKQSKVLTDCFGLSAIRAQAYLRHFGAGHQAQARHVYERHARS